MERGQAGMKRRSLPVSPWRTSSGTTSTATCAPGKPAWARAACRPPSRAPTSSRPLDDDGDVDAGRGLTDLVLDHLVRLHEHRPDHERMDVDITEPQHLVGAPVDRRPQMSVVGHRRLLDEPVSELVPNEWLRMVGEVGEQHLRRRCAGRHGLVALVDQLDDADVGVEHQHFVVGRAHADQPFSGSERVDDRRSERLGDRPPMLRQQIFARRRDHERRDARRPACCSNASRAIIVG